MMKHHTWTLTRIFELHEAHLEIKVVVPSTDIVLFWSKTLWFNSWRRWHHCVFTQLCIHSQWVLCKQVLGSFLSTEERVKKLFLGNRTRTTRGEYSCVWVSTCSPSCVSERCWQNSESWPVLLFWPIFERLQTEFYAQCIEVSFLFWIVLHDCTGSEHALTAVCLQTLLIGPLIRSLRLFPYAEPN